MPYKFVSEFLFIRIRLPSTLVQSNPKQFFRKLFRFRVTREISIQNAYPLNTING